MSAVVTFVEVILYLTVGISILVLAAGLVTKRPRRVTEWQAQCNARPTSNAVSPVYDRQLAPVVPISSAASVTHSGTEDAA